MKHLRLFKPILSLLLTVIPSMATAPVRTLAWNGHQGAVTFTFDDACRSQVAHVLSAIDSRGIAATFNVSDNADFVDNQSQWIAAAQKGNEITNHTSDHVDLSKLSDSASIADQIIDQAKWLRSLDPSMESVTFAYPYCNTNAMVDRITNREAIIGRTCGGTALFSWSKQPTNWMRMTSHIVSDDLSYANALKGLDNAKNDHSWFVTLNHGVGGDWLSVSPEKVTDMFDRALANDLWIDTYQRVASYWRASFTMDTVQAVSTSSGWEMRWTSPHARMPKQVHLRIELDKAFFTVPVSVFQNGKEIPPEADGSYDVEFMDLALEVRRTAAIPEIEPSPSSIHQSLPTGIGSMVSPAWFNLSGRRVGLSDAE